MKLQESCNYPSAIVHLRAEGLMHDIAAAISCKNAWDKKRSQAGGLGALSAASAFVFASAFGYGSVSFDDIGGVKAILEQVFEKVNRPGKKRSPVLSNRAS